MLVQTHVLMSPKGHREETGEPGGEPQLAIEQGDTGDARRKVATLPANGRSRQLVHVLLGISTRLGYNRFPSRLGQRYKHQAVVIFC